MFDFQYFYTLLKAVRLLITRFVFTEDQTAGADSEGVGVEADTEDDEEH